MMKYFDSVEEIIRNYSSDKIKELKDCNKTMQELKNENKQNNPYRKLAENFQRFENGEKIDNEDWYFYKFLKSLHRDDIYIFPLKDGSTVETKVDLFRPFDDNLHDFINPQWHLLVSSYAYLDAAFNHMENEYAQQIVKKTGWTTRKPIIKDFSRNKVLRIWMEEAIK